MLKEIGDFIERPAGHTVLFVGLIGLGVGMYKAGITELSHELIAGCIGALLYSMRPKGGTQ